MQLRVRLMLRNNLKPATLAFMGQFDRLRNGHYGELFEFAGVQSN
jgi:hypothetical protein